MNQILSVELVLAISQLQRNKNAGINQFVTESCAINFCSAAPSSKRYDLVMMTLFPMLTAETLLVSCLVVLVAGVVKGMVGFAMPMIMISLLGGLISPDLALAGLILPTLLSNGLQALRQGPQAAWQSLRRFKLFLLCGFVLLIFSAQMVRILPGHVLLLLIGVPVVLFTAMQLLGWQPRLHVRGHAWVEASIGAFAGFVGGMSGIWGPPTILYLTALDTPKQEQIRVQGVIYGLGALALFGAHVASGVLRAETLPFSVAMIVPALIGMWIGFRIQDRINQGAFRKATLLVLFIAGLNLIRRSLFM